MNRFRGGLVFKAHRLLYHSTLGSRVIKKKKRRTSWTMPLPVEPNVGAASGEEVGVQSKAFRFILQGLGCRVWGTRLTADIASVPLLCKQCNGLNLRTTTPQKSEAVSRRAHV